MSIGKILMVLFIGFYVYMIARPISYGMSYNNKTVYEGEVFEGSIKFYPDGRMLNKNTNFEEALEDYYYYKDGYVFSLMAETEEEYKEEVAYINDNFDAAVAAPFYAMKINAFQQVAEGTDGYVMTYTCTGAIVFAIAGGVAVLALVFLTVFTFVLSIKAKAKKAE